VIDMKRILFIVIIFCLISTQSCYANTIEIQVLYNLSDKLEYSTDSINKLKILSAEFIEINKSETFNPKLYNKLDSFIKNNKNSLSSLTALHMIAGMCFWPETFELYSKKGEQIINFLINNYSNYIHGKIALIVKASILSKKGLNNEAISLLKDNYEVILNIEKDVNFKYFIQEMNLEFSDDKNIIAGFYHLLGSIYIDIKDYKNAALNLNKVINYYPETNYAKISKEMLKSIK